MLTQTQSGTFAISPRGPLGVITVRLKPEAASRLARAFMHELMNVKIGLRNIFKDHDIALLRGEGDGIRQQQRTDRLRAMVVANSPR